MEEEDVKKMDNDPLKTNIYDLQTQHLQDYAQITRLTLENEKLRSEITNLNDILSNEHNLKELRNKKLESYESELGQYIGEIKTLQNKRMKDQESYKKLQDAFTLEMKTIQNFTSFQKSETEKYKLENSKLQNLLTTSKLSHQNELNIQKKQIQETVDSQINLVREKLNLQYREDSLKLQEKQKQQLMNSENSYKVQLNTYKSKLRKLKERNKEAMNLVTQELEKTKKKLDNIKENKLDGLYFRVRELSNQNSSCRKSLKNEKLNSSKLQKKINQLQVIKKNLESKNKKLHGEISSQRKYYEKRLEVFKDHEDYESEISKVSHTHELYKKNMELKIKEYEKETRKLRKKIKLDRIENEKIKSDCDSKYSDISSKNQKIESLVVQEMEYKDMIQKFTILVKEQEKREDLMNLKIKNLQKQVSSNYAMYNSKESSNLSSSSNSKSPRENCNNVNSKNGKKNSNSRNRNRKNVNKKFSKKKNINRRNEKRSKAVFSYVDMIE